MGGGKIEKIARRSRPATLTSAAGEKPIRCAGRRTKVPIALLPFFQNIGDAASCFSVKRMIATIKDTGGTNRTGTPPGRAS